jgi:hypothetical protein
MLYGSLLISCCHSLPKNFKISVGFKTGCSTRRDDRRSQEKNRNADLGRFGRVGSCTLRPFFVPVSSAGSAERFLFFLRVCVFLGTGAHAFASVLKAARFSSLMVRQVAEICGMCTIKLNDIVGSCSFLSRSCSWLRKMSNPDKYRRDGVTTVSDACSSMAKDVADAVVVVVVAILLSFGLCGGHKHFPGTKLTVVKREWKFTPPKKIPLPFVSFRVSEEYVSVFPKSRRLAPCVVVGMIMPS